MRDYQAVATSFNYQQTAELALQGDLTALNACVECCDRHAHDDAVALYCEAQDGSAAQYTFSHCRPAPPASAISCASKG